MASGRDPPGSQLQRRGGCCNQQRRLVGSMSVQCAAAHGVSCASPQWAKPIFVASLFAGVALRIWASTLGYNLDLWAWYHLVRVMAAGENLYASTVYDYGPIWPEILRLIAWADSTLRVHEFHTSIAGFLTLADVGIAVILVRLGGYVPGILFMLCPVSILITGYHSQIDNLAVLFGLLSWYVLRSRPSVTDSGRGQIVLAAVLMGTSLATKHVMLFFPVWILFWPGRPVTQRIMYCLLAYALGAAAFVPFATSPAAIVGISKNVIHYRGLGGGLLPQLVSLVAPLERLAAWFSWVPLLSPLDFVWAMVMVLTGIAVARKFPRDPLFVYLVALLAYAPSMADQYLTIPVASCAMYWRRWQSWAYIVIVLALLSSSPANIGSLHAVNAYTMYLRRAGLMNAQAQLPMLLLLLSFYYAAGDRSASGAPTGGREQFAHGAVVPASLPDAPC
jgi:hypothetical protein